jgi:hypothetical protein
MILQNFGNRLPFDTAVTSQETGISGQPMQRHVSVWAGVTLKMDNLMHPSLETCMHGEPCNATRDLRRVKTFFQLARSESSVS